MKSAACLMMPYLTKRALPKLRKFESIFNQSIQHPLVGND